MKSDLQFRERSISYQPTIRRNFSIYELDTALQTHFSFDFYTSQTDARYFSLSNLFNQFFYPSSLDDQF
jgi:hypothetical protein